jgi:transcriptional regulator with XRE-family HTH domain
MIFQSVHKRPRPHFPLYELLQARGRSQYDLAKQTRISTTYLNRIARGKASPSWKVVLIIADALGADLGEFSNPKPPIARPRRRSPLNS